MTSDHNRWQAPAAEELAAYADGELPVAERARVETWLVEHPEARAEVEAQQRLLRLWQAQQPPEPSAAAWEAVRSRLQTLVPLTARRRPRSPLRRAVPWLLSLTAAAALAFFVGRALWPVPVVEPVRATREEAAVNSFPVAEDEDVNIISMDVKDAGSVLVEHPLDKVEFVTAADIGNVQMQPAPGGSMPRLSMGEVPMVVAEAPLEERMP